MGKIATKKATEQLQKIYDYLGEYGGIIKTYNPDTWWNLDLEIETEDERTKEMEIGVYSTINGDLIYDPCFELLVRMDKEKILEVEILNYTSETILGTLEICEDDMTYGDYGKEKDQYGLKRRFSSFMDNMVEEGPYLTNPKSVEKYDKDEGKLILE